MYNDNRYSENQKEPFLRRLSRWIGIVSSVLVVLFLIYWVVGLGRRDASEVPVIAAIEGEPRVAPENPGGQESDYEGLQVNSVLEGEKPEQSSDVVLAPEPDGLSDIDPAVVDESVAQIEESANAEEENPSNDVEDAVLEEETEVLPRTDLTIAKPAHRPELLYVPSVAVPADEAPAPTVAEEIAQELAAKPAQDTTPEPEAAPEPEPAPNPTAQSDDELGTRLPSGTPLIQLAANGTAQATRDQWVGLQADNRDLLGDKNLYIEKTVLNGKTYFRLRVQGFSSSDETRSVCATLMARNVQCLAVTAQ